MRSLVILILAMLLPPVAFASDEWVSTASTPGTGRLEVVTNYIIFSSGTSYEASIPRRIEEGTRIDISYKKNDTWVRRTFDVIGISANGKLCRLHNEKPSRYSASPGDTIYVKPCRYK